MRRCSTSGALRYSDGSRSNASSSAVVPSSRAASSYSARAWPISFCAIDENATSSSSIGAIPVHSESRQPSTSSSSARPSRSSFTCFLQSRLDRVAVDAPVLEVELVRPVVDDVYCSAGHEPQRNGLPAAAVLLARPRFCELRIWCHDRAGMPERLPAPVLPKDFPLVHVSTLSRTHFSWSR